MISARAEVSMGDFWFESSFLLNRYTRGRNQTPFPLFIVAISFLSEESYLSFFVPCLSSKEREREASSKPHVRSLHLRTKVRAVYANKVRARRVVCLRHELHRRRRRAFTVFSAEDIPVSSSPWWVLLFPLFFFNFS